MTTKTKRPEHAWCWLGRDDKARQPMHPRRPHDGHHDAVAPWALDALADETPVVARVAPNGRGYRTLWRADATRVLWAFAADAADWYLGEVWERTPSTVAPWPLVAASLDLRGAWRRLGEGRGVPRRELARLDARVRAAFATAQVEDQRCFAPMRAGGETNAAGVVQRFAATAVRNAKSAWSPPQPLDRLRRTLDARLLALAPHPFGGA